MTSQLKQYLQWLCICAMVLAVFGCKSKAEEQAELDDITDRTLSTTTYNYTKYELYDINFMNADKKFEIENAASGGSIFFRSASFRNLEGDIKVSVDSGECCFIWNVKKGNPVSLRVIWNLIYNLKAFEDADRNGYDDRKSKMSQPGSVWCEALVEISPPFPTKLDHFYLHFLPDGTIFARVGEVGNLKSNEPLSVLEIQKHSNSLPDGKYCLKEIANPWYGIPRKPHME